MQDDPHGTLEDRAFLFTDIAGSTLRWQADPDMAAVLSRHDELVLDQIDRHDGSFVKHTGDGVLATFAAPEDALAAAAGIQRAMRSEHWPTEPVRVRIGVHHGAAEPRAGDWFGTAVNLAARLVASAHGGQTVLTETARAGVTDALPEGTSVRDLGDHTLRDLRGAHHIWELVLAEASSEFPPLRSERVPILLPVPVTTFVGREEEIGDVLERLLSHRVVTLTGIGGTGKTRLATEVARRAAEGYAGGVYFIDLSTVTDADGVFDAVGRTFGLPPAARPVSGRSTQADDRLVAGLRGRDALLVLDNCEHQLDPVAALVDTIVSHTPATALLTSREALGLPGESIVAVPSLPTGGAAELFGLRADAAHPAWHRDAGPDADALVAEICHRLDGIPLAVELAAARVGQLSLRQLADRLDDRFRLLAGPRRRLQRQQTLATTMQWSWDLLDEEEQTLLRRLAVFVGGFTEAAAEGICSDGALPRSVVFGALTSLVSKSLVAAEPDRGGRRYRLLETVRLYAGARSAEADDLVGLRRRHRDWYLAWVEALPGAGCLFDYRPYPDLARAEANLRAAIEWSLDEGERAEATRLVTAAGLWWQHRDGSRLSDAYFALVRDPPLEDPGLRTMALSLASMAARSDRSESWNEAETLGARAIESAGAWTGPALGGACSLAGVWRTLRGLSVGDDETVRSGMSLLDRAETLAAGHPGYEFGVGINRNTALMSAQRFAESAVLAAEMHRVESSREPVARQPWALSYASLCETLALLVLGRDRDAAAVSRRLRADQEENRRWSATVHPADGTAAEFHGLMFDGFPMAVAFEATGWKDEATELVLEFGDWMLHDPVQLGDRADVLAATGAWLTVAGDLPDGVQTLASARRSFREDGPYAKPVSILLYRLGVDAAIRSLGKEAFRAARDAAPICEPEVAVETAIAVARDR